MIYHTGPLKRALLCPYVENYSNVAQVEVLIGQIKFFVKTNLPERIQILFRVVGAAI